MATNPTKQLRELLLWARKERIVLSSVTLGNLSITIERDHGLVPPSGPPAAAERKANIYEQHAGPLAALLNGEAMPAAEVNETTVEDEE